MVLTLNTSKAQYENSESSSLISFDSVHCESKVACNAMHDGGGAGDDRLLDNENLLLPRRIEPVLTRVFPVTELNLLQPGQGDLSTS
ncbi:hypothetical protein ANN_01150 [Periplaneta americana]|uniref:Uncharacterized protein n=1 Tax=Periplaneta americana TaxID=6978 RepID=A0ABQ8TV78_PERAM|nr:hypothetical protein ANN_01150 [Periplaneta americana]